MDNFDYDDDDFEIEEYEFDFYDDDDDDDGLEIDEFGAEDSAEFSIKNPFKKGGRRPRRGGYPNRFSYPKIGRGRGYWNTKLKGLATKNEVKAGFKRVGMDVKRNARGIKTNSKRNSSNSSRISGVARANRRQTESIKNINADFAQQKQMQLMMSLLDDGARNLETTADVKVGGNVVIPAETAIPVKEVSDGFTKLLPFLMMNQFDSPSGSGSGFGMDPMMMMMFFSNAFNSPSLAK